MRESRPGVRGTSKGPGRKAGGVFIQGLPGQVRGSVLIWGSGRLGRGGEPDPEKDAEPCGRVS